METGTGAPLTVVNRIKGGIGNQLFQQAFGASLAARLGARLATDGSYFAADPYGFSAAVWNLTDGAEATTLTAHAGTGSYLLREGQLRALDQLQALPPDTRSLVLDGYWQGEAYFDPAVARSLHADLARHAAARVDAALAERIRSAPDAVAIHVRRRDYGHMGLCRDEYYLGAIDHLRQDRPGAELFVFSDEPNYTRHLLQSRGLAHTVVRSGSDLGDLWLMSLCRHFVISNSSYSWWGAWFGEQCPARGPDEPGTVICPKEWVTIDDTPSPCPARWVQVPGAVIPFTVDAAAVASFAQGIETLRFQAAIRDWFGRDGDRTLRVHFPELGPDSRVLDLGGYKGDWTAEIVARHDAHVLVFEPIGTFCDGIRARFAANPKVKVFQCGLSGSDQTLEMHHSADGTGAFVQGSTEQVSLVQASRFFEAQGLSRVDLLKVNIEGGEYDLLEHLIGTGLIGRVRRPQVQFHDFVPDALTRRARITERLSRTHRRSFNFHFVWEEWVLAP